MHDPNTAGCGDERLEAEGEVAVARLAADSGDLRHAATHLAFAMATDPQLPEVHEALAELAVRAGGTEAALELFPMERPFIGEVVCRAHLQAAAGHWEEAVRLIAAAIKVEPDRPWAHAAWLTRDDLPELVSPRAAAEAVARAAGGLPEPLPQPLREALLPFDAFIRAMVARHPEQPLLLAMASGLARRLGDTDRAVRLAREAYGIAPEHIAAVMLGNALRAAGRSDEALAVWQAELERDPSDAYLHVDVAELYAATGRPAEGLPWLERVLATEPDHPKAAPALLGLRHQIDGGAAQLLALADHLREHPEHEYAAQLLARFSDGRPWLDQVHAAQEASVHALHQMLASPSSGRDHEIQFAASTLEPPSSLVALRHGFPNSEIVYHSPAEPDPRVPLREVGTRIWRYEGFYPHPAVSAPSLAAAELIRETAEVVWPCIPAAYDHAVRLAGLGLDDLVGVLAHPPLPREDEQGRWLLARHPELWIRAVQAFACLGILHHRADQPWAGSARREVLVDLLFGSEDWVTEAAGFALVTAAWADPVVREDVGRLVGERLLAGAQAYRSREVTILSSLCSLMLACPWADEAALGLAVDLVAAIDRDHAESDEEGERISAEMVERARAAGEASRARKRPSLLGRIFGRRGRDG